MLRTFLVGLKPNGSSATWSPKPRQVLKQTKVKARRTARPSLTSTLRPRLSPPLSFGFSEGVPPVHFDPSIARKAGFDGPILHGPAILGHVFGTILKEASHFDAGQVGYVGCDYRGVLYPGETLRLKSNRFENGLNFQSTCVERETQVLERGVIIWRS